MTVKELAELAGVSPATISLVLNNKKGVSEKKRQEILALIEEKGYTVSRKENRNKKNILFIRYSKTGHIVEENAGFISKLLSAVEGQCRKAGYSLTILTSEDNLKEALGTAGRDAFYGIIILGTELEQEDYHALENLSLPYVVVDNVMPDFDCNSVAIDNRENVFKAVKYFADQGFTELGYFKGNENIQNLLERQQSVFEAAAKYHMAVPEENVFTVPTTMLGAFEATEKYIKEKRKFPKCIFADNDIIALGLIKALKQEAIAIPEEISIIGFDNIPFGEINSPSVSTMNVDAGILGSMTLSLLEHTAEDPSYRNVKVRAGGDFIKRQSTL